MSVYPFSKSNVISIEQIEQAIQIHFQAWFPGGIPRIEPIADGFSQQVYAAGERYVIRVAKTEEAIPHLSVGWKMTNWLSSLEQKFTIAYPRTLKVMDSPMHMALCERMKGVTPGILPQEIRKDHVIPIATMLQILHRQSIEPLLQVGIDQPLYLRTQREQLIKGCRARLEDGVKNGWLSNDQIVSLTNLVKDFLHTEDLPPLRVPLHADLHPLNLLVNESGQLTAIIDWDDAYVGHPATDLAVVYHWIPPMHRAMFWEQYGPVDSTVQAWARMTAIYISIHILWAGEILQDASRIGLARQMLDDALSFDESTQA